MNIRILIIAAIIACLLVSTVSADYVPAGYNPVIEQNALDKSRNDIITGYSQIIWGLIAVYESSEHQNSLLEEQNRLIKNQTHAMWVETCYAPHPDSISYGNYSAWQNECLKAGYPSITGWHL